MMNKRFSRLLLLSWLSAIMPFLAAADPYSQNFDSPDWTVYTYYYNGVYGFYTDGAWTVGDCGIFNNPDGYGDYPAGNSLPNAAWLDCTDALSGPTYIATPELVNGAGTLQLVSQVYVSGGASVLQVQTSPDGSTWTPVGSITCSSYQAWSTNTFVINAYSNVYVSLVKISDAGGTYQYVGIDDISITLPPSKVTVTNIVLSPGIPVANTPTYLSATIIPQAFASNVAATLFYSTDNGGSYSAVAMSTTGANYYVTAPGAIPAISSSGSKVLYYIQANLTGVYGTQPTNFWPSTAPATNAYFIIHSSALSSIYTNMLVKGSLSTNMILTANNQWQAVSTINNLTNPAFYFNSGTTNWGEVSQAISNLSVYGTVVTNSTNIVALGTVTNHLCFMFNETNLNYSIERCAYADFSGWAVGATNFGTYTNSENWIITRGRLNRASETNLAFSGNFCMLSYTQGTLQAVQSPNLTGGIGLVSFWYRNYSSAATPPAGLTLQKSIDGTNWVDVTQVTNIISPDYLFFTNTIGSTGYHYVRILNNTNGIGSMSQICIDNIAISEPRAIVTLSNALLITANPVSGNPVSISVDYAASGGASNPVTCKVFYRAPGASAFDSSAMTLAGNTFSGTIPPAQAGQVDYYFECTYGGFRAAPAQYPVTAPLVTLSFTNPPGGPAYREQNFDFWSGGVTTPNVFADYIDAEWEVFDAGIFDNGGGYGDFPNGNSAPNAVWLDSIASGNNPYILSPLMTNGVGTVYFTSQPYAPGGQSVIAVQTSPDNVAWATAGSIVCSNYAMWTANSLTISTLSSVYVRLLKTSEAGAYQYLGIDDIIISPPHADVIITNVSFAPGYPSSNQAVTIQATITSTHTNFPAFSLAPKVCYLSSSTYGAIWQTNSMTYIGANNYIGTIPATPIGTVSYFIRCDFDGYYYTNGLISEKTSPSFSPAASPTVELPSHFYSYDVRRFMSPFASLAVTGNIGSISMALAADNEWQGVWKYTNSTITNLSLLFAGFQKYSGTGGVYSAGTNIWGDSDQINFSLPTYSFGDTSLSNIFINVDTQYYGAVTFRFNTTNNSYVIRRGSYQDFDNWLASPDYFEESIDMYAISTTLIDFNDWTTNDMKVSILGHGLEDFENSFPLIPTNVFFNSYTNVGQRYSTNGWYVENTMLNFDQGGNTFAAFNGAFGSAWPGYPQVNWLGSLRSFKFDYRVMSTDNYFTVYGPGITNGWSGSAVEANMFVSNASPAAPYISLYSRITSDLLDTAPYYEYRLARSPGILMSLSILRNASGFYTNLASTTFIGQFTNQLHVCKFIAVTNNNGSVYLEAYYNGALIISCYDIGTSNISASGSIGAFGHEADVAIDNIGVRNMDIQRFGNWSTNIAGTYTNAKWVITGGYPSNNFCTLVKKNDPQAAVTNFDSWTTTNWGTYTNAGWILSDGVITSSVSAYSSSNFALLRNDGPGSFTNSWIQFPGFSNAAESASFYCRNIGTNSIQFQVLTSADSNNWSIQSILTNIDNSFPYTKKLKIRFKGYSKTETLTNFPALITLTPQALGGITGFSYSTLFTNTGADLRFADSNETRELKYEIDNWDPIDDPNPSNLLSSCVMWLKADFGVTTNSAGAITNWTDNSGKSNNLILAANKPTWVTNVVNGLPVVRLNGVTSKDALKCASIRSFPSTNWHIYLVQKTRAITNSFIFFLPANPGGRVSSHLPWDTGGNVYWDCGGADPNWSRVQAGGLSTTNNFSIWQYVSCNEPGKIRQQLWQDGLLRGYRNGTAQTISTTNGIPFYLGNDGSSGLYAASDVAELMIFKDDLTVAQQQQVGFYLSRKYGISSSYSRGSSLVWVQVPELASNSWIWAYWGGAGLSNMPVYTTNGSPWSAGYEGVWHMNDNTVYDSTRKGYDGAAYTMTSSVAVAANVTPAAFTGSGALSFDGTSSYIDIPDGMASFPAITISLWANPIATRTWARFMDFGNGSGVNNILLARNGNSGDLAFQVYGPSINQVATNIGGVVNGQWQQYAATIDTNGTAYLYRNGLKVAGPVTMQKPQSVLRLLNYIGRSNWSNDQYYQGFMDEMSISSVDRSSNWVWAAWYNTASNSAFCDYTSNVVAVAGTSTYWNAYSVGPFGNTKYVRIFKSQQTAAGQWLGVDNMSLSTPAPNVMSPYIAYSPANLSFKYAGLPGCTGLQVRVLASPDAQRWTAIAEPFTAFPGIYNTYQSAAYAGHHYFRIENVSTGFDVQISDIYVKQSQYNYYEPFSSGAHAGWDDRAGIWTVNNTATTFGRKGYPGTPVTFIVETNYDPLATSVPGEGNWFPAGAPGSASSLNYQSTSIFTYFWDKVFYRIRQTGGSGNLVIDNLTSTGWRDQCDFTQANGWYANEFWISNKTAGNTNDHVIEFWRSKADPVATQYVRSALMTNGIGQISFDYRAANPPVSFNIDHSSSGYPDLYVTVASVSVVNTNWNRFAMTINNSYTQYIRIVHSSSNALVSPPTYEYYELTPGGNGTLPNFDSMTPVQVGACPNFIVSAAGGWAYDLLNSRSRWTDFAFRFRGKVSIPADGAWTFYTDSDDGSMLYIDGAAIVNNNYSQGETTRSGTTNLIAGWHDIIVTYAQGGGGWRLWPPNYEGPGVTNQPIPDASLVYPGGGPILYVDNIQITDYKDRDEKMWWAYNAKITSNETTRLFEGKSCYLNNDPANGAVSGLKYTAYNPCVQSPSNQYGIGEISFWYRRWDDLGTNAANISIFASANYLAPETNWETVLTLSGITNTDFRYFTTNVYMPTNYFLRISCQTNQPTSRLCLDNICIVEPLSANVDIGAVYLTPTNQPLYTNRVNIAVELKNFVYAPSNIVTRLYYKVGSNSWGNLSTITNFIPLDVVLDSNTFTRTLTSSTNIPALPIDSVVQYYVSCSFDGLFASHVSPKVYRQFTNPSWYYPIDLNSGKPASNRVPYYYVYSCPTGSAWINEINFIDGTYPPYVEICGKAGSILTNWHVRMVAMSYNAYDDYTINYTLPNTTNGYGFWLLGYPSIAGRNATLNNPLQDGSGIRLIRSMGAYEKSLSFGAGAGALVGFTFIGQVPSFYETPLWLTGSSTNRMVWTNNVDVPVWSPGTINAGQELVPDTNRMPVVTTITINRFWKVSSTLYFQIQSSVTNADIYPAPWYSTDLVQAVWLQVTNAVSTNYYQPTGIYTQSFTMLTNNPYYFYKIKSTNAP